MRLTLEQDYSVRIIYELCRTDGLMDVNEIAEITGVTKLFTQKIIRKLCAAGLVESKKGAYGGYRLRNGLTPEKISMYDVLLATEEEGLLINACLSGGYQCTRPDVVHNDGVCHIKKAMALLNDGLVKAMKEVTFDKFLK